MIAESIQIVTAYGRTVNLTPEDMEGVWTTVNKEGTISPYYPELGPCWTWTGSFFSNGYPRFNLRDSGKHFSLRGNRVSFILSSGEFTDEKNYAIHSCHDKTCICPAHIRAGSCQENTMDRERANRSAGYNNFVINCEQVLGESSANAKLKNEDIREIRKLRGEGIPVQEVGRRFGVTGAAVSAIARRITWRHIE